jgi:hypothetical protein
VQLGLPPGPIFKEVLTEILNASLNGDITTKEQEIELAKKRIAKMLKHEEPRN